MKIDVEEKEIEIENEIRKPNNVLCPLDCRIVAV